MKVILATSNKGKIKEIKEILNIKNIIPYKDILGNLEIEENGKTFKENALIKARTIYEKIKDKYPNAIVISDDSGISVPALNNEPGIYSARYAGANATDKDNLYKLINELKKRDIKKTKAYYTAAVAIVSKVGEFVVHGWMHGYVIDEARGDKGFGYDPMFIPKGFDKTLGELDNEIKSKISHRAKALKLAKMILKVISKSGIGV
ncbi:RdgB/HAM1 family non-canonical purine NTP pyrophosphatase [Nitrosophilus kaiyonis]|uniref:RdgB/HAM1 family non-canonical purine NTP pyrophosphatase n=1 Tax=Nitrosophilus kaiyonis TaxID=2930200 RepID=UPI0024912113|nr:RdgB/HAM1 family non-canonical purine NTP pyrophosphatase [Nitrosophilus kaiyonis]